MIQRTYGQVKDFLSTYALNNGVPVDDTRLIDYTNRAVRELMNEGDWPGVVDTWYLRYDSATGMLSLPGHLDRLLNVSIDDAPKEIRSPWFEFVQYGPGSVRDEEVDSYGNTLGKRQNWTGWLVDRGMACTQYELPTKSEDSATQAAAPWYLRVYATVDEDIDSVSPVLHVDGLDEDGHSIRTTPDAGATWISGENIDIDFAAAGGFTQSVKAYSQIGAIVKPVTNQAVRLTAWNGTTEIELSRYEWDETTPAYRRYYVPELAKPAASLGLRDRVVRARCRRRFIPVAADNDVLIIGNELALVEMMIAQWKRQNGNIDEYASHKMVAVDLLRKESVAHNGKTRTPAITFSRGWGLGSDFNPVR